MIPSKTKILPRNELASRIADLRRDGLRIVFTNGCFDLMHLGHLRYLAAARAQGDCLVVAVNADRSLKEIKGPLRPILPAAERMRVLAGLECVDFVTEFAEATPHELLRLLRPDVLVKGANYSVEEVVGREVVEGYGGEVRTLELTRGHSTSAIVERIVSGSEPE